jgi:hypothetical protein
MKRKLILIQFAFISLIGSVFAQPNSNFHQIITDLDQVTQNPSVISFNNALEINNTGGHLQGIQKLIHNQNEYFILTGSSSGYSYYAIVKTGEENMVISVNKILEKPFKHAGGFQIYDNLMAIGVEDNDAKNQSKVFIFHLENPEKPPEEPLAIIDRMGTHKRATAGCVGIIAIQEKILVVVGDWDTAHLDFYRIDKNRLYEEGATLELEYSLNSKNVDRSNWIDKTWLSYQNINFVTDKSNKLYLAGLASNNKGENVIDLFEVESQDLSTFNLQKIYSHSFPSNKHTKFQWGAGIYQNEDGSITILSSEENIEKESMIHSYK